MSQPAAPPSPTTYVNPGSVLGTAITFIVLGIAAVVARFSVRKVKRNSVGPDDWLALAALFFALLYFATQITAVAIGTEGYHSPPAPHGLSSDETALPPIQVNFKKIQYIVNIMFVLVIGSIRLSTLFFYRRIFLGRGFNIAWWIVVVITSLWTVIFFFTSVFQCGTDFSAFWGSFAENAEHCFYIFGEVVAIAVTDVALDVAVLLLPLPWVWKLQMPNKQKLGVSIIFLLGFFSVAAGATRMAMNIDVNFLHHPGGTAPVLGLRADDVVGIVGFTLFWQLVQVGVALIASNLLTFRPLFAKLVQSPFVSSLRNLLFSTQRSGTHTGPGETFKTSDNYSYTNESSREFRKPSDSDQYLATLPMHSLGENGNRV